MNYTSKWDQNTLINELMQGMEQAAQLKLELGSESSHVQEVLLQRVVSSFEKALLILQGPASVSQSVPVPLAPGALESSVSGGSPLSEKISPNSKDHHNFTLSSSKKRKTMPTWTERVKVSLENGLEGPSDDGYSWRKYGQKPIFGAKYPRSYYRCTYRHVHNCWATKQVQRSDDQPIVFDITYRGYHTCNQATNKPISPLKSPSTDITYKGYHTCNQVTNNSIAPSKSQATDNSIETNILINHQEEKPSQMLINFQTNILEKTGESSANDASYPFAFQWTSFDGEYQSNITSELADESLLGTNSASFLSPAMPESDYFSVTSYNMNNQTGYSRLLQYESDLTDIFLAHATATNLTNIDTKFPIDTVDFDPESFYDM